MPHPSRTRRRTVLPVALATLVTLAAAVSLGSTGLAAQNTGTAAFQKAAALDKTTRAAASPALKDLRAARAAYEAVVRDFPQSGYCDDALWAGSDVAILAFERFKDDYDLKQAVRLLKMLQKEYPTSDFVKPAAAKIKQLQSPTPVPPAPRSTPPPASPPASQSTTAPVTPPPTPPAPAAAPPAPATVPLPTKDSAARMATPPPAPATGPATARSVTHSALPSGDRVTIELDREVAFTTARVSNPDRLFIDLQATTLGPALADRAQTITGALVANVRAAKPPDGSTRLVIELTGTPRHSLFVLYEPFRLNIDIERPGQLIPKLPPAPEKPAATPKDPAPVTPPSRTPGPPAFAIAPTAVPDIGPPPAPPATTAAGDYSVARQLGLGVSRIVIDPGHGGHDPGAQANDITEAELVLDVALRLEKLLQAQKGTQVVLTRRSDVFIPLEERTARANKEGADLFVSIHANASSLSVARGVETYYLNFATTPDAQAVAARENATSAKTMGNLPEILRAIALNTKLEESRELANMVQTSMTRRLKVQNATLRDLGVKQAPFVVLIGAQMPSILAEISFVTNKTEAGYLKQSTYRQKIAQSLFDAIVKYQGSLKAVAATAGK
jgi:N-acetylmuramoyl-L-alanine amidase